MRRLSTFQIPAPLEPAVLLLISTFPLMTVPCPIGGAEDTQFKYKPAPSVNAVLLII